MFRVWSAPSPSLWQRGQMQERFLTSVRDLLLERVIGEEYLKTTAPLPDSLSSPHLAKVEQGVCFRCAGEVGSDPDLCCFAEEAGASYWRNRGSMWEFPKIGGP